MRPLLLRRNTLQSSSCNSVGAENDWGRFEMFEENVLINVDKRGRFGVPTPLKGKHTALELRK